MSLMHHEPWSLLDILNKEFGRSLALKGQDDSHVETSQWLPAVDIKEDADKFTLFADIPGVEPKDIEISMDNNVLSVKGKRQFESKKEIDGFTRVERQHGVFYRRFTLPSTANAQDIQAKSKQGVLEIVIPKIDDVRPRSISVVDEN